VLLFLNAVIHNPAGSLDLLPSIAVLLPHLVVSEVCDR
jgi:hypothetical protein